MSRPTDAVVPLPRPLAGRAGAAALLGLCAFLFLYGLNTGDLYRTEGLRAILAAECLRSGNWVVPMLYGEPLLTKPPGMYAAIALASWSTGTVTTTSARLPSVLAALLTVFLVYRTFARCLGRGAGLAAGAILPASFLWLDRVPSAEIDMLQLAWVTAALLCFLRALESAEEGEASGRCQPWTEWFWWQAALGCVAGGLLTKWTAPAFFYLTVVPLLWWRGRLRLLLGRAHLLSLALAALPCLGWAAAAVSQAGWEVCLDTVGREALQRLSPAHHPRPYPWGEVLTFPLGLLLANLPWSAFALPALGPGFARLWDERGRRLLQLLHCWAWINLLFWSAVPGHRPRHGLPLQPALAGLATLVWVGWLSGRLRWPLVRIGPRPVLLGLLGLWLAVKLVFVHEVAARRDPGREPRAKGEQLAALVPPGNPLYLCRLKDEGILFYYGRPARRLPDLAHLPASEAPLYCLLIEAEWRQWSRGRPAEVLRRLRDEQGAELVLVRVWPAPGEPP